MIGRRRYTQENSLLLDSCIALWRSHLYKLHHNRHDTVWCDLTHAEGVSQPPTICAAVLRTFQGRFQVLRVRAPNIIQQGKGLKYEKVAFCRHEDHVLAMRGEP